jgi:hypothetical protein
MGEETVAAEAGVGEKREEENDNTQMTTTEGATESSSSSSRRRRRHTDDEQQNQRLLDQNEDLYTHHEHDTIQQTGWLRRVPHLLQAFPSITEQPSPSFPPPPSPPPPEYNRNDNFTINLGKALDHLRVDVPLLFDREPDMSIYTEDIRLRDDSRVYASGKFGYKMVYFSLRLAKVFMPMPPLVEVINIRWCPARQSIDVRFQVRVDTLSDQLYLDAVSSYKVNNQGVVYEHVIEKVIRNDLMEKPSMVSLFYTTRQVLLGGPGTAPIPDISGMGIHAHTHTHAQVEMEGSGGQ